MVAGVKNRIPLFKKIGSYLIKKHRLDLAAGVDANGASLAPVTPWTRWAGVTRGRTASFSNMKPLLNTGDMARGIQILRVNNSMVSVGFHGGQAKKSEAMQRGLPGRMVVSAKRVKGKYGGIKMAKSDGHKYIRINTSQGWRTKQVDANNTISIRPRARRFYFIGRAEGARILEIAREYVVRLTGRN